MKNYTPNCFSFFVNVSKIDPYQNSYVAGSIRQTIEIITLLTFKEWPEIECVNSHIVFITEILYIYIALLGSHSLRKRILKVLMIPYKQDIIILLFYVSAWYFFSPTTLDYLNFEALLLVTKKY